jgi:hypothetical protein
MEVTRLIGIAVLATGATAFGSGAGAQTPTGVAPSGLGVTEVTLTGGGRGAPAAKIRIEYGQPHARGRTIAGTLIPRDSIWRTGANAATILQTDVDLVIGTTRVPKGRYSLFTLWTGSAAQLIVNKQSGQAGTDYDQAQDLARIPLRVTMLTPPLESFSVWLIPATQGGVRGELRMAWGTLQYSVDWRAAP